MNGLFRKGRVAAGAVIALAAAVPSIAPAHSFGGPGDLSPVAAGHSPSVARLSVAGDNPCMSYSLTQAFLAWGDTHEYTLLPGESPGDVSADGWQLAGGAHLVSTSIDGGGTGQVLDMPAGSVAVTPPMCVNASNYPEARAMVSDIAGSEGVAVYVSYQGAGPRGRLLATGFIKNTLPGWDPSRPIMLHAGGLRGMHMVQFTLVAYTGEYQLYNLYVDPRRGH